MGWLDKFAEFMDPCSWNSHKWIQYKAEDSYMGGRLTSVTIYWKCDGCGVERFSLESRIGKA